MTVPRERTNAIKNTRMFLYSLLDPKKTPRIPKKIRREACRCLRHFPSDLDILLVAEVNNSVFGQDTDLI